jgi:hypothetical protein
LLLAVAALVLQEYSAAEQYALAAEVEEAGRLVIKTIIV